MSLQIIFICTGNVCRSPMAEYLFRRRRPDDMPWEAVSRGLFAADGAPASPEAIEVMAEEGIDLTPHRSRMLSAQDMQSSDLAVCMTQSHRRELLRHYPDRAESIRLMTSFGTAEDHGDIPDPIALPAHVYRRVRDMLDEAMADLILYLLDRKDHTNNGERGGHENSHRQ